MKNHKIIIYLLSFLIPIIIFFICATINDYMPIGQAYYHLSDAYYQYPGIILEYANLLKSGNIFYSWNAGLGFNFFGTIAYYGMSPLNLLACLANSSNYPIFIMIMTYLRFGLLGLSMCFYLSNKKLKSVYIILLSVAYSLMGFSSTYYYNFMWIDSIILLPLVIHGLDKILDNGRPHFYIITLTITIIINYYIGYMICIFSLIWFIYNIINKKEKKKIIQTFIVSSLLPGLMAMFILLPSFFVIETGKASLYKEMTYSGTTINLYTLFYKMLSGTYRFMDLVNGPALTYSSILVLLTSILFFFNKNFTKKEKISTFIILLLFYLSFSVKALNFFWHGFLSPIWWPSRFAFTFSFFLITLAARSLEKIHKLQLKLSKKIIILEILIPFFLLGIAIYWNDEDFTNIQEFIYMGINLFLIISILFLVDKEKFVYLILILTIFDVSFNTYVSLKNNYTELYKDNEFKNLPEKIHKLQKKDGTFNRMEVATNKLSANMGLYFNYHGINYFDSNGNQKIMKLLTSLGFTMYAGNYISLQNYDPVILSLFNIKYLYGENIDYYTKEEDFLKNEYPLSIAFLAHKDVKKNLKYNEEAHGYSFIDESLTSFFPSEIYLNRENLVKALIGEDILLYKIIEAESFTRKTINKHVKYTYEFKSDDHYMMLCSYPNATILINGIEQKTCYNEINKGDRVSLEYYNKYNVLDKYINLTLLNLDKYEYVMKKLNEGLLNFKTNTNGHILEGTIKVNDEYSYCFTTIGYIDGVKVYVDNKEVKPDVIMDSLIGIPLDKGEHKITIDFIPKGFKKGCIVSFISLIITIIYLAYRRQKPCSQNNKML